MSSGEDRAWADDEFRAKVANLAGRVLGEEDPEPAAMELWSLSFSAAGDYVFAEGLWNIWGRITDEWTHPDGSDAEARRLAIPAAKELQLAIGDEGREQAYCDRWIYERLDIVPS